MQTYGEKKLYKKPGLTKNPFFARLSVNAPEAAKEGKTFFLSQADLALNHELGEEIDEGIIDPTDDKWASRVQMRALEMLQDMQDLLGPITFAIQKEIEEQASYTFLGYQDFTEWAADSRLRKGGMYADHRTWINVFIPKAKAIGVKVPGGIDQFFLVAVNQRFSWKKGDGPSRHKAMRMATPDLNLLCKAHTEAIAGLGILKPEIRRQRTKQLNAELKEIFEAFLGVISDDSQANSEKQKLFDKLMSTIRPEKMTIYTARYNGHVVISGKLNHAQYQRLLNDLAGAVTVVEAEEDPVNKILQLTCLV